MKQDNVPNHSESVLAMAENMTVSLPCSDPDMIYDALTKRYKLTQANVLKSVRKSARDRFTQMSGEDWSNFIDDVSDDVYECIMDSAFTNFELYTFMIATGWGFKNFTPLAARNEFMRALLKQVEYRLTVFDTRDMSGIDRKTGHVIDNKNLRGEFRHMSQQTLTILKGMGLMYNGEIAPFKRRIFEQNREAY